MIDQRRFINACRILMNLDKDVLEDAGVIKPNQVGGSDWTRFNKDILMFIVKLPDERFEAIWHLIEERQPQPRPIPAPIIIDGEDRSGEAA
jgi:hypothetical protein